MLLKKLKPIYPKIKPSAKIPIINHVMNNQNHLYHIAKSNPQGGFTLPEAYFERCRNQILQRVNYGGYKAPDTYFEKSKTRLLNHIKPKPKLFYFNPIWFAAALLIVTLGINIFMPLTNYKTENLVVTDEEIMNYVLADKLSDLPIEALVVNEANSNKNESISEEVIEGMDEETLVNEL